MESDSQAVKKTFERVLMNRQYEMERMQSQLAFAERLCEWHPDKAAAWRPLIAKAAQAARKALGLNAPDTAAILNDVERSLAPLSATAKRYSIYCVGHAHIDMNWMWSWPETVSVTVDTFSTVLRLMEEFPSFHFSQSQASVYDIVERFHPDMLERIRKRVKEGRWEVTASHWVETDKNMASGESLCRHLLLTRRYMQALFGLSPEDVPIDWSPDTFGHAHTVPTYLARGGVRYLYLHRPGAEGGEHPEAFWWRGPDGSRVLVRNDMRAGYNGAISPDNLVEHLRSFVTQTRLPAVMYVYGVGDHGGGPTRRDVRRAIDLATWPVFPEVRFSTARAWFERLEKEGTNLPTVDRELNPEFAGCYTTETLIKKANRFAENRLVDAEFAATLQRHAMGTTYPAGLLTEGWRDTLFSQFHDILPGSGVHDTRTYAHGLFQKTMAATSMIETQALRALASRVATGGAPAPCVGDLPPSFVVAGLGAGVGCGAVDGAPSRSEQSAGEGPRPFVVFNPTPLARREIVEATVWENAPGAAAVAFRNRRFSVRLSDGRTLPAQTVNSGLYWGHEFVTVSFPVETPALGYETVIVTEGEGVGGEAAVRQLGRTHHCRYSKYEREPEGLENEFIRVELDPVTGGISRLLDRRNGLSLIEPSIPAQTVEYVTERPHGMTAWLIDGNGPAEPIRLHSLSRKLTGPYRASIELKLKVRESDITLVYELRAGDPRLYLSVEATWFQRGSPETGIPVLRLVFPWALADAHGRYEIPFGAIDRVGDGGREVPALRWGQVTGRAGSQIAGCVIANDSKYGYSLDGSASRLTLIRSSYDPDILPEIGKHEVHVTLLPFKGECPVGEAIQEGLRLNQPLRVIGTDVHAGDWPVSAAMLRVSAQTAIFSAIKLAEDGDGVIVRFYEPAGQDDRATIRFEAPFFKEVSEAVEVDLLERLMESSSAQVLDALTVTLSVPARGIATVRIRLRDACQ